MSLSSGIEHRIGSVEPKPGYRLMVTWVSGDKTTIDFAGDVRGGGIWASLRDETTFSRARTAFGGAVLEWPEPAGDDGSPRIDIDADGLWWKGLQQKGEPRTADVTQSLVRISRD